jgi:hypothetical protein
MIASTYSNPEKQVYYIGGLILDLISKENNKIDFFDIFQKINENRKISMNLYTLSLDWLFLLGVIDQEGVNIIKCS